MAHQYSNQPPADEAEVDMQPSTYNMGYLTLSSTEQQPTPLLQTTVSAAPCGSDPSMGGMSGERRRSKLGYQRTSVACGHCRKRKIRCIRCPLDAQGRCVHCIRLKKECSFHPVDQQAPTATTTFKAVSRTSTGPKIASDSSSPIMGHSSDPYQTTTMPLTQEIPPPTKPAGIEARTTDTKYASLSTSKLGDVSASWTGYPSESSLAQGFSTFPSHTLAQSAALQAPVSVDSGHRDDMGWSYPQPGPPPPASTAFGGGPIQYSPSSYHGNRSSMSADMYSDPIASSLTSVEKIPGTTLEQHELLSADIMIPESHSTWHQPSCSYGKPVDPYAAWHEDDGSMLLVSDNSVPHGNDTSVPGVGMYQYATGY